MSRAFPKLALAAALVLAGCVTVGPKTPATQQPAPDAHGVELAEGHNEACGEGRVMKVHFFNVGQALSALVELPDGQSVLVDTGDSRTKDALFERVRLRLVELLPEKRLSMLWITHQHSDHLGRAEEILRGFRVGLLVENGTDGPSRSGAVKKMRTTAAEVGTPVVVVSPTSTSVPLITSQPIRLTAVVPSAWTAAHCNDDPNDCSIGLRIDFCGSSVLFVGDSEATEEKALAPLGPVTVLQAPHHGANTSSSDTLLKATRPRYVVVSSGLPNEGANTTYCHPNKTAVQRLSAATGAPGAKTLRVFKDDKLKCADSSKDATGDWEELPVSDGVLSTARDGDITLTTRGAGDFEIQVGP